MGNQVADMNQPAVQARHAAMNNITPPTAAAAITSQR